MIKNFDEYTNENHHIDAKVSREGRGWVVRQGDSVSYYGSREDAQKAADWKNNEDGDQYYRKDVWTDDEDDRYWTNGRVYKPTPEEIEAEKKAEEERKEKLRTARKEKEDHRKDRLKNDDMSNVFVIYGTISRKHRVEKIYFTGSESIVDSFTYDLKSAKMYTNSDEAYEAAKVLNTSVAIENLNFRKNDDDKWELGVKVYTKKHIDRL